MDIIWLIYMVYIWLIMVYNGWFMIEKSHLEMDDDWGYPYFRKPPCFFNDGDI